jgi:neutral ceramidase
MTNYSFPLENGTYVQTCPAALGYSFAAGTSDGPGAFDFTQNGPGEPNASPIWGLVSKFLKEPSEYQKQCHYPKPILLDVGEITRPYLWTPNVVDVQIFRVGQFYIIISPGEATTMAGRRWKSAIYDSAAALSLSGSAANPIVVIGGPANSYTHYISTPEEYSIQRYEGASTLYGSYTLNAYINVSLSYLPYLASTSIATPPGTGPLPPDNANVSLCFIPGVIYDHAPFFKSYGDIKSDVNPAYTIGSAVHVTFVGANPRNNLRLEGTYAAVEKFDMWTRRWTRVRDDSDWSLVFNWRKMSEIMGTSEVEIVWETEKSAEPGEYRIRYYGDSKAIGGEITPFEGLSRAFVLLWGRKKVGDAISD